MNKYLSGHPLNTHPLLLQGLLFEFKEDNNYKIGMSNSPYQKDQMTKIGEVAQSFCFKQSQRGVIN